MPRSDCRHTPLPFSPACKSPRMESPSFGPRRLLLRVLETVLRLPGALLLELWWRTRDLSPRELFADERLSSYLEVSRMVEIIKTRDLDQSAAQIISYSVLFWSLMFVVLPLGRLVQMYLHALSLLLFGVAHYMSSRYVQLEQSAEEQLVLDDFVKLERHGFHFLAQLLLSVAQSCLLGLEQDRSRVPLAIFAAPIVARMCGCPLSRLIAVHNAACCGAMLAICIYVLNRAPTILMAARRAYRQLRAILIVRGVAHGAVAIWRRLRMAELLATAWMTMFVLRVYVETAVAIYPLNPGRGVDAQLVHTASSDGIATPRAAGAIALSAIAHSTCTPFSLLALALTVSYVCKLVVEIAQWSVGGTPHTDASGSVFAHGGYTEAATLVLLCAQTGVLGMRAEQKAFLLGLVLFIVLSALLQNLFEMLEPRLLALSAMHTRARARHARALCLAVFVAVTPLVVASAITRFLPIDLWCIIIVSNSLLTSLHTISTVIVYCIMLAESRSVEPWSRADDLVFLTRTVTGLLELLLALFVVAYGVRAAATGQWTVASIGVLVFHAYFNIWRRVHSVLAQMRARHLATQSIARLACATNAQLSERRDLCAICLVEMSDEARITPCKHLFHGSCLRKWLSIRQACPLCYASVDLTSQPRDGDRKATTSHDDAIAREEDAIDVVPVGREGNEANEEEHDGWITDEEDGEGNVPEDQALLPLDTSNVRQMANLSML